MERVEWPRSKILEFIGDYKSYRLLWDPAVKDYHIKSIKYAALEQLSDKYDIEVRAIRCKIKSLRSSFHREHGKVRASEERGVQYRPMWFAYESMSFILEAAAMDALGCGEMLDVKTDVVAFADVIPSTGWKRKRTYDEQTEYGANCGALTTAANIKTEIIENDDRMEQPDNCIMEPSTILQYSYSRGPVVGRSCDLRSRLRSNRRATLEGNVDVEHNLYAIHPKVTRDEYTVFGEYVGMTLRKLRTESSKIVVKHLINNLLFEAEIGKYDNGIPITKSPPSLYRSPNDNDFDKSGNDM